MKKNILIVLFFYLATYIWAVSVLHVSPQDFSRGSEVELLLEITTGVEDVASVDINYRKVGETAFQSEPMQQDSPESNMFHGKIPSSALESDDVEYRFELRLHTGSTLYLPPDDGMSPLYVLHPQAPQGTKTDGFVLLSDEPSISQDDGYILAVSFLALQDDIDPKSIKVFVSGKDVSKDTHIDGAVLLYRDEHPRPGIQRAMVVAQYQGKEVYSDTWVTEITPGTHRRRFGYPISYRGTVNFAANVYDKSNRDHAFGAIDNEYRSWVDLYANYGNLGMQANLLVSSLESSNKQPVNRYTFGINLPFLDVYLGDNSPYLSNFTLSGKNLRGIYGSLHFKNIEFILTHGESVRKTTYESDSTGEKSGSFKQEALGARLRIGSENGFMVGISGSRHRDIVSSLDEEYYRYIDAVGDTIYTVRAQDNAVLSLDARLNVPDQNVIMGVEVAGSLLNRNTIPGPLTGDDLEEYGLELEIGNYTLDPTDFADLFVVNKNMEPFKPSKANLAWTAYLRMYVWHNFLNVQYSETGSAFHALGASYQMNDSKLITVSDQITVGRLLTLTGSYSISEDNIMGHKSETNNYQNIAAQAILRIPRMPYLKASFADNRGENKANEEIISDFTPHNQDSQNMSFGVGYNIYQIPYVPTQVDISYRFGNNASEIDQGAITGLQKLSDNKNNGLSFTMINRFNMIPLRTLLSFSTASNENILLDQNYKNQSFSFRTDYSFLENMLQPYFSYRNTSLKGDHDPQSFNYYNLGMEAYPVTNMSISADIGLRQYSNDADSSLDNKVTTLRLMISQRF